MNGIYLDEFIKTILKTQKKLCDAIKAPNAFLSIKERPRLGLALYFSLLYSIYRPSWPLKGLQCTSRRPMKGKLLLLLSLYYIYNIPYYYL